MNKALVHMAFILTFIGTLSIIVGLFSGLEFQHLGTNGLLVNLTAMHLYDWGTK